MTRDNEDIFIAVMFGVGVLHITVYTIMITVLGIWKFLELVAG